MVGSLFSGTAWMLGGGRGGAVSFKKYDWVPRSFYSFHIFAAVDGMMCDVPVIERLDWDTRSAAAAD